MKRGKKAVSAIIATVLLILLTIAAAGVLYSFMVPLIRGTIETMLDLILYLLRCY